MKLNKLNILPIILLLGLIVFIVIKSYNHKSVENYYYTGPMHYSSDMFEKANRKTYNLMNPYSNGCGCSRPYPLEYEDYHLGRRGLTHSELNIDGHQTNHVRPNWRRDDTHFETHKLS